MNANLHFTAKVTEVRQDEVSSQPRSWGQEAVEPKQGNCLKVVGSGLVYLCLKQILKQQQQQQMLSLLELSAVKIKRKRNRKQRNAHERRHYFPSLGQCQASLHLSCVSA